MMEFLFYLILITFFYFIVVNIKLPLIFYDIPNNRSSHKYKTLKIGGLVLFPFILSFSLYSLDDFIIKLILFCSTFIFIISFIDDLFDISIYIRLLIHLLCSFVFLFFFGNYNNFLFIFFLISLIWICNLYNFMDGIDGLASIMTTFGFIFLAIPLFFNEIYHLYKLCIYIAIGSLSFFYFNYFKSKIFLGDSGAVTIGFLAGCIGLCGANYGAWPIWYPTLIFSTFGADATLTLVLRVIQKNNPLKPHKEYFFHKLKDLGFNKKTIVLLYAFFIVFSSSLGLFLLEKNIFLIYTILFIYFLFICFLLIFINHKWKKLIKQ